MICVSLQQHLCGVNVAEVMCSFVWLSVLRGFYFIVFRTLIQMTEILGKEQGLWQTFLFWQISKKKLDYFILSCCQSITHRIKNLRRYKLVQLI